MIPKDCLAKVARRWRWGKERQKDVAREWLDQVDTAKLTAYLNKRAGKPLEFAAGDNNRTRLRKAQQQCGWPVDTHAVLLDFAEDDGRLWGAFARFLENYDGSSTSGCPLDAN
jgi:hypothetical protein